MFGEWINHLEKYARSFSNARPFEHVLIPNFFSEQVVEQLVGEFPAPNDANFEWKRYDNPIENKFTLNNFEGLVNTTKTFERLQSPEFVNALKVITGIPNLESDPVLHGAGLHAYPNGGKLDAHLDYQVHPITGKERRVNLIVYLNRTWQPEWGGALELWNSARTHCETKVIPGWNEAILFKTSDMSYHGLPRPIQCPDDNFRRSLAVYYVSAPRSGIVPRPKAEFFPDPSQTVNPELATLYNIRKTRLITQSDLDAWPTWRQDGDGWW